MQQNRQHLRQSLRPFGTSIFGEMTALAAQHGAVNLSQGFPDFDGPAFVKEAACHAIMNGANQYARSMGVPSLVRSIAGSLERHYGISRDPDTQIGVFSGATEAIFSTMMGLLEPDDEVILFEPFFDSYPASVVMAGATPRYCTLHWPDFSFDPAQLESLFNPRTRLILLNTPHNPTGKVFTRSELELIAQLCITHNVLAVTDEVYEHITYDDAAHLPLATLEGMNSRTLTISSTGKTFSLTGWKIGYVHGPSEMVAAVQAAHQFVTFSTATPFQHAMAAALQAPDSFYYDLRQQYTARRALMLDILRSAGIAATVPQGTYYVMADIAPLGFSDDVAFARYLTTQIGVACIPPSSFYAEAVDEGKHLARFAFCKEMSTLEKAGERLMKLKFN